MAKKKVAKKAAKKAARVNKGSKKTIGTFNHGEEATRKNLPSAEMQSVLDEETKKPVKVTYTSAPTALEEEIEKRNLDQDPQLIWRGKRTEPLEVPAPPLYIQEKVKPKAIIDDLLRRSQTNAEDAGEETPDLFSDFNGLPDNAKSTDFYQHEGHWTNRMILGDSLQVMASLAEREGLRGKVQCIYLDPPYGIKFNSNFQWSTTSRDVKDGKADHISREPEQVKAFRDTWRDGIHSYLTYLRDRLIVSKDLLNESGSIFVQIGDENVHRVRALMDEVFGVDNFISEIFFVKTSTQRTTSIQNVADVLIWYSRKPEAYKLRKLQTKLSREGERFSSDLTSMNPGYKFDYSFKGRQFNSGKRYWSIDQSKIKRLEKENRLLATKNTLRYVRYPSDAPYRELTNVWTDTTVSGAEGKVYVVQTGIEVVKRAILMSTDPGDLVLDPTCGSGTTAYVAEQWGRRWITIDTSRVALALARARIMGARYPFFHLKDSQEGQIKEAALSRTAVRTQPTYGKLRQGFVYERVPHITLKSIANNAEIDVIWDTYQAQLEPLREQLNTELKQNWEEWGIPRDAETDWSKNASALHNDWWELRIERQKEIDASIAAKADYEYLYDKPCEDKTKVRVAGPFTVDSLMPHRTLAVDENDEIIDGWAMHEDEADYGKTQNFTSVMLETLEMAGVQQAHKEDKIKFSSVKPFPGTRYICGEGYYTETDTEDAPQKRAGIFIGPEFGTVSRPDLVAAAREAADIGFDVLITCAFNYDAHSTEFEKLGALPILKARMNADLHMADELKNTGAGNLFIIFGEPDISIEPVEGEDDKIQVRINGVDVFKPSTGKVESSGPEGIACWFIDTDYNEESFFVRHAYFLGQNDPYKQLKTTLKAEIDQEAWDTLNSDISRAFKRPSSGRIAVKVINHLGDEVMKVYSA